MEGKSTVNGADESLRVIRVESRWMRNEEGEHRFTVCIHPDDVPEVARLCKQPTYTFANLLVEFGTAAETSRS